MKPYYSDDAVTVYHGDCLDVLAQLPDASVDSVVTDPPYGLEFMGKDWDSPWKRGDDINADAGMTDVGYTDGGKRLPRPTFTGSTNPKCLNCKGTQRGRRDGTAIVKVCTCDEPAFPNVRATEMSAFQSWCEQWATECLRVLKPGGHMLAFGGTRTWHRLACAVEDAGFEIRDSIAWLYGSGFPKSMNVSKAIDRAAGELEPEGQAFTVAGYSHNPDKLLHTAPPAGYVPPDPVTDDAKRWQGWGTALKPAFEPIVVGRKPLSGTVAGNVLAHGVGALNIDGCRVATSENLNGSTYSEIRGEKHDLPGANRSPTAAGRFSPEGGRLPGEFVQPPGRWPSNVVIDPDTAEGIDRQSGHSVSASKSSGVVPDMRGNNFNSGDKKLIERETPAYGDEGGASRFFPTFRYQAKAPTDERPTANGVAHPTVKPLDLMRWLVRLVTPPGGLVLEPFAGSGTTAEACIHEHMRCIAIERETDYLPLIVNRLTKPIEIGFNFNTGDDTP